MANTYYDSQLTAAEIEAALKAIDGVIVPANNGKVLAINNGKLEARSVQWGGSEAVLESLSVTENGNYTPEAGVDGFYEVHVSVPNSYTASDEGKVVSNSALVAQTARASQITQNGTYDTTLNDEVTVNVSGGGSAVVQPLNVTQDGTYNPPSGVDGYAPVTVNVSGVVPINILHPQSYSGSVYNSPDPNVSISRASDDKATVTFNGTKTTNDAINYQLQIPNDVIKTFVGCKARAVSNDSRVAMHIQKRTSPWTYYGGASHGEFVTIPSISESGIVFCVDITEAGEYNNVTGYLEVFGIE